ncbi:hypothetical protein ACOI1H_06030 [Loktanella sp. DJP18]|uniref:hypothetical protein n=1 Tax=Loktanella sp. DJP18 TaxID=3409788 RepID=UPI003BB62D7D
MADPNLEKLERQYEQAKARLQSARARKATQDRKIDARRKIVLGGALIERASRDPDVTRLLKSLVEGLARAQDRKAFEGWSPPASEADRDIDTVLNGGGGADSAGAHRGDVEGAHADDPSRTSDPATASNLNAAQSVRMEKPS